MLTGCHGGGAGARAATLNPRARAAQTEVGQLKRAEHNQQAQPAEHNQQRHQPREVGSGQGSQPSLAPRASPIPVLGGRRRRRRMLSTPPPAQAGGLPLCRIESNPRCQASLPAHWGGKLTPPLLSFSTTAHDSLAVGWWAGWPSAPGNRSGIVFPQVPPPLPGASMHSCHGRMFDIGQDPHSRVPPAKPPRGSGCSQSLSWVSKTQAPRAAFGGGGRRWWDASHQGGGSYDPPPSQPTYDQTAGRIKQARGKQASTHIMLFMRVG